jgi:hypothetical protein
MNREIHPHDSSDDEQAHMVLEEQGNLQMDNKMNQVCDNIL